jgi:hypothetical protein
VSPTASGSSANASMIETSHTIPFNRTEFAILNGNGNENDTMAKSVSVREETTIIPIIVGAVGGLVAILVAIILVRRRKHRKDKVRKIEELDKNDMNRLKLETHLNILFDKSNIKSIDRPHSTKSDHSRVNDIGILSKRFSMKPMSSAKMELNPYIFAKSSVRPLSVPKKAKTQVPLDEIKTPKQVHTIKKVMLPVRPAIQKDEFASYNVYNKRSSLRF